MQLHEEERREYPLAPPICFFFGLFGKVLGLLGDELRVNR